MVTTEKEIIRIQSELPKLGKKNWKLSLCGFDPQKNLQMQMYS